MYDIDYIAVPLDFSRSSRAALAMARAFAERGVHIEPVHVVDRWPAFMERVLFPYSPLGEDGAEIEEELRTAASEELARFHGLDDKHPATVLYGPVKQLLADHVARVPASLVLAGAVGEGNSHVGALGSVADRLVRTATCPTLLLREREARPQIGKVLVALDLTEGTERIFNVAVALAQRTAAELEVVHVLPDPLAQDQGQVLAPVLNFNARQAASRSRDRIEALFDRLFRQVQPSYADAVEVRELARRRKVILGDPATTIIGYAERCGADLIVVGSQDPRRATSLVGRVAEAVLRRAPVHVCVVPTPHRGGVIDDT